MEETNRLEVNTPFETPPQTPQTPQWADIDEEDESWVQEALKGKSTLPTGSLSEPSTQSLHSPPDAELSRSISVIDREIDEDEKPQTNQEVTFNNPSTLIHQPRPTRPRQADTVDPEADVLPDRSEDTLFTDFSGVHTSEDDENDENENIDGDEEVGSYFSDSSDDDSDEEPSEKDKNDTKDSEKPSSPPPPEEATDSESPKKKRPADLQLNPKRLKLEAADPHRVETGGNSPNLKDSIGEDGPLLPPPNSDYGQLKRIWDAYQAKPNRAPINPAQLMLFRELGKSQDKYGRVSNGNVLKDSHKDSVMQQREKEIESHLDMRMRAIMPSLLSPMHESMELQIEREKDRMRECMRTRPIMPSLLSPAPESMELRMERMKGRVRELNADLTGAKTQLAGTKGQLASTKAQLEASEENAMNLGVELNLKKEELDDAVNEAASATFQLEIERGRREREIQAKEQEIEEVEKELIEKEKEVLVKDKENELFRTHVVPKFESMKKNAQKRIAAMEEQLREKKVDNEEAAATIGKLEDDLRLMKELNMALEENKELLDEENNQLSGQVDELEKEKKGWLVSLEIFGIRRMNKKKRRRSGGETFTLAEEIENLERRLQLCSEKLDEEKQERLHFKRSIEVLNQELTTEKTDTVDLLAETHQLSSELKESKVLGDKKEKELRLLAAEIQNLIQEKADLEVELEAIKHDSDGRPEADDRHASPLTPPSTSPDPSTSSESTEHDTQMENETIAHLRAENATLRVNLDKLKHLIPPSDSQTKYQAEIVALEDLAADLNLKTKSIQSHYDSEVDQISKDLGAARRALDDEKSRHAPLLRQIEDLARQIVDRDERLQEEKKRSAELEDRLDPHYRPGSGPDVRSVYDQAERVRHFNERSALMQEIQELGKENGDLKSQTERDGKTIRSQREQIRGLEDDIVSFDAERRKLRAANRRRSGRRSGSRWPPRIVYDTNAVQKVVREQGNADAEGWGEREKRWEEMGICTRVGEDGSGVVLEFTGRARRKSFRSLREGVGEESEGESELERVTRSVRVGVRKWGWR